MRLVDCFSGVLAYTAHLVKNPAAASIPYESARADLDLLTSALDRGQAPAIGRDGEQTCPAECDRGGRAAPARAGQTRRDHGRPRESPVGYGSALRRGSTSI